MALKTIALPRTFYSSGRKLADPNPALSIEDLPARTMRASTRGTQQLLF